MAESIVQSRFQVGGMDCAACAIKIDTAVRRLPGVAEVAVSVTAGSMVVDHAPGTDLTSLQKRVAGLGYAIAPSGAGATKDAASHVGHDHDRAHDHAHADGPELANGAWWATPKMRLTMASGGALAAAWILPHLFPSLDGPVFAAAMLVGLVPIAHRALTAAQAGSPFSIEMLMSIAAVGAVAIGAAEEGAVVVFLFLVGEMLEGVAAGRARTSIRGLAALVPKTVRVERDGSLMEVPAEQVALGTVIVARPGDRIGADGEIIEGEGAIDEAPVTGESVPVRKGPGALVFAGTINTDAVLRIRVLAVAADNTIARVIRLVEEAQESKAPTERFIDRFSRVYTPAVVAVAMLVAVMPPLVFGGAWSDWIYRALALLLIGCPCALVISTPAAIAAALSAGARRGLLMKGGAVLETLGKVTDMALDKTGTLTEGKPKVTDIIAYGRTEDQVLAMAASLEAGSSHPLALAILDHAKAANVMILLAKDARAEMGKGVAGRFGGADLFLGSASAAGERVKLSLDVEVRIGEFHDEGKTVSVLLADGRLAGVIAMRDEPRADAMAGLQALKQAGITPVMLTGDNRRTAEAIGKDLGIAVHAELLPQDKLRIVREMQARNRIVGKVGDGINDAPALAAANVGIAMGGGTDVALETADAAVLHGRMVDVGHMVALARAAMANIHQNITIALGLKAVFLVTTVAGITGLWPAILADTGATVLVTANAMRLLAWRGRRSIV